MSTTLRQAARETESVFEFIAQFQDGHFRRGVSGAGELAALYYRVRERETDAKQAA